MTNLQEWEKEFDKEFGAVRFATKDGRSFLKDERLAVKDFIRNLLAQREQQVRKETLVEVERAMIAVDFSSTPKNVFEEIKKLKQQEESKDGSS